MSTTIVPDSASCASANRSSSEAPASGSVIFLGSSVAIAAADVKVQQHDIKIAIAIYKLSPDITDCRGFEIGSSWPILRLAGCC